MLSPSTGASFASSPSASTCSLPSNASSTAFSSPSSMVSGTATGSGSGGAINASFASYSFSDSANAELGSCGANGLNPNMVASRFIAALRTNADLSPKRPIARSATTSQWLSGTAFFSAIADQVCNTRARVNAEMSCTLSTSKSRNPCFALNNGAVESAVLRSRSSFKDPDAASEHTKCPNTVTNALRNEYASPSK